MRQIAAVVCLLLGGAGRAEGPRLRVPETGTPPEILALAFSADGKSLAAAGHRLVAVYDPATGKPRWQTALDFTLKAVACSPDGGLVAAGGSDAVVHVFRADTGEVVRKLKGHAEPVRAVAFAAGGKRLLTADDKAIRSWDLTAEQAEADESVALTTPVDQLVVLAKGDVVRAGRYHAWVCAAGQLETPRARLTGRRVAAASSGLVVLGAGPRLRVCDPASPASTELTFPAHRAAVTAVACTPDGRFAASIGSDSRLAVWDPLTGEQLFQAEAEGDPAAVAVSPDGRTVAAGGAGIVCWEVPDPRKGPAVTDDAALSRAWDGLTDEAVVPSSAAIRILRRSPAATALLRDKLKPDEEEMARVSTLIKELSADRFPVRESATAALRKTGTKYLAVLRLALETADTEESRRRLRSILGGLEDPAEMYRQRLRTARGVRILARAGTPEARKVLEELAAGDPNWPVTSEARAVLRPGKCVTVRR